MARDNFIKHNGVHIVTFVSKHIGANQHLIVNGQLYDKDSDPGHEI